MAQDTVQWCALVNTTKHCIPTKARILYNRWANVGFSWTLLHEVSKSQFLANKQTIKTYGSSRPSVRFSKYYLRYYRWISTTYVLLESLHPRWTRWMKTIPSLPQYEIISLWSLQRPLAVCVCVCVRVRVYSSSVTQLTDENAFFPPAAIHVLSKCGISYFADLTGLLHTPIRVC